MASTIYDIIIRAVDNAKSTLNGTSQQLDNLDKKSKQVNTNLQDLGQSITRFGQVGAVAFGALTARAVAYADTISDTADATQVSIQTILGLKSVVEGTAVTLDDVGTALLRFNENLGTAASSGGKQLRDALGQVGVSVQDLASLETEPLLLKTLEGLAGIEDRSKAAALATDIFGKSLRGAPLDKFGADLRKAIADQQKNAESVKQAAAAADTLEVAFNKVAAAVLVAIQPATQFIAELSPQQLDRIATGVLAIGAALLATFAVSTISAIASTVKTIASLVTVLRSAAAAAVVFLAVSGPAGWAAVAAGVVAAGGAIYGLNKLLDDNIDKSQKAADAATGIGGKPAAGGKPAGPVRTVEPLKSEVQKVRTVLATAAEAYAEAQAAYNQLINVFQKTPDLNLQALQYQELARAAETLGKVIPKPAKLIERDFNLALAKNSEELRINGLQLQMTAAMQQKFANETTAANQALEERRQKLQDINFQQGLFDQLVTGNRLTLEEQNGTLARADVALANNKITLREYAQVVSSLAPELLSTAQAQNVLRDSFAQEVKTQDKTDRLAELRLELARASGNVRLFLDAYNQYKTIFGATAEGELALAIKGARDDIKLTDARKNAYEDLATQFKNGEISARLFREAASNLGIDEGRVNRIAALYGSVSDQIEFYNLKLEQSVDRLANKFEDDLTQAILTGKNLFSSFKDFVGSILNDIAAQIIKQQIAAPIANALGGLAKGIGASIFGKVAAPGAGTGSAFGALGNWFAGFFADGGAIGAGKVGIVGENGPEFISGPARITPMSDLSVQQGDTLNVNFHISAIDTQNAAEFIVRNKPLIAGVVEQAYNKRGRRGPMTVG